MFLVWFTLKLQYHCDRMTNIIAQLPSLRSDQRALKQLRKLVWSQSNEAVNPPWYHQQECSQRRVRFNTPAGRFRRWRWSRLSIWLWEPCNRSISPKWYRIHVNCHGAEWSWSPRVWGRLEWNFHHESDDSGWFQATLIKQLGNNVKKKTNH
jgi:hypothetical protein